ncbi:MAG: hypothetical protein COW93_03370 [Parcubacteria group bacterium CG22_combo_CG10-13_8_21_14_all_41_9]|nr:MAG: hypothetical protein COW93_03370 [Parcubacteria group bacterium CG22_combo_CG10-13_8_21_14_all_41_9]
MKLLGASYSVIHDMVQVFEQRLIYGSPAEQFATAVQRIENSMSTKKSMGNRRNAIIEAIRELGISVP